MVVSWGLQSSADIIWKFLRAVNPSQKQALAHRNPVCPPLAISVGARFLLLLLPSLAGPAKLLDENSQSWTSCRWESTWCDSCRILPASSFRHVIVRRRWRRHSSRCTAACFQPSLRRAYTAFVPDLGRNLGFMWDKNRFRVKYEHRLGGKLHPTIQGVRNSA